MAATSLDDTLTRVRKADPWPYRLLLLGAMLCTAVLYVAMATPNSSAEDPEYKRHVSMRCRGPECLAPRQFVTQTQAVWSQRNGPVLVVDIRERTEPPANYGDLRIDATIPLMENGEFRIPFGHEVDEALRAARVRHQQPVILVSPSVGRSILAALLLQERGYSRILILND